jgi:hypothetical protein
MKFCYIDESGTDEEKPFAIMAGVIVDTYRMNVTIDNWRVLLSALSNIIGEPITEIHTRDIYPGNNIWRRIEGSQRARLFSVILEWFNERKHEIVYSVVDKNIFYKEMKNEKHFEEIKTLWRFMALHICLSIQKYHKTFLSKGKTILIFDEQKRERDNFVELFVNPPQWTDTYYSRNLKKARLDQIIDVPYFGDSKYVMLIQLADFISFFLRRYVELKMGEKPDYENETTLINQWAKVILDNSVPKSMMYLSRKPCACAQLFNKYAPSCIL